MNQGVVLPNREGAPSALTMRLSHHPSEVGPLLDCIEFQDRVQMVRVIAHQGPLLLVLLLLIRLRLLRPWLLQPGLLQNVTPLCLDTGYHHHHAIALLPIRLPCLEYHVHPLHPSHHLLTKPVHPFQVPPLRLGLGP